MSRLSFQVLIGGCLFIAACAPQADNKSAPVTADTPPAATDPVATAEPAATPEPAPATEPVAAEGSPAPGAKELSPTNAQIQFIGKHTDDKPDRVGVFTEFKGQAMIDPATSALTAVSVEIPVSSLATPFEKLNDHLKSPDFFDVREYPTAKFESTGITTGEAAGQQNIAGKLTLMSTTKEVSFPAEVSVTDGALKLNGKLTIKRSEYGMNKLLEGVKDDVDINVSVGEATQLPKAE